MADKVAVCIGMVFEFEGLTEKEARNTVHQWMRKALRENIPPQLKHTHTQYRVEENFQQALVASAEQRQRQHDADTRLHYAERGEPIPEWLDQTLNDTE